MKNLNLLLFLLILAACGSDPDDFKPEKPDGCKSDDLECQEALKDQNEEVEGEDSNSVRTEILDEDEEQTKDSPSEPELHTTVSVDVEVEIDINTEAQAEEEEVEEIECAANKLCRGSTKAEVLDLLGDPTNLSKSGKIEIWTWHEFSMDNHLCGGSTCEITFTDGAVSDQARVHTRWLDLENF